MKHTRPDDRTPAERAAMRALDKEAERVVARMLKAIQSADALDYCSLLRQIGCKFYERAENEREFFIHGLNYAREEEDAEEDADAKAPVLRLITIDGKPGEDVDE
jgi:hypothetical protein